MSDVIDKDHDLSSYDEEGKAKPEPVTEDKIEKKKEKYIEKLIKVAKSKKEPTQEVSNSDLTTTKPKKKREVYMTWGKYKGKTVKEVISFDEKYASWLYRQEFVKKFDDIYKVLDDHFK